jgi:hypothetical protein
MSILVPLYKKNNNYIIIIMAQHLFALFLVFLHCGSFTSGHRPPFPCRVAAGEVCSLAQRPREVSGLWPGLNALVFW